MHANICMSQQVKRVLFIDFLMVFVSVPNNKIPVNNRLREFPGANPTRDTQYSNIKRRHHNVIQKCVQCEPARTRFGFSTVRESNQRSQYHPDIADELWDVGLLHRRYFGPQLTFIYVYILFLYIVVVNWMFSFISTLILHGPSRTVILQQACTCPLRT